MKVDINWSLNAVFLFYAKSHFYTTVMCQYFSTEKCDPRKKMEKPRTSTTPCFKRVPKAQQKAHFRRSSHRTFFPLVPTNVQTTWSLEAHLATANACLPTKVIGPIMWAMARNLTSTQTPDLQTGLACTDPPRFADVHIIANKLGSRAPSAREPIAHVVVAIFKRCRIRLVDLKLII